MSSRPMSMRAVSAPSLDGMSIRDEMTISPWAGSMEPGQQRVHLNHPQCGYVCAFPAIPEEFLLTRLLAEVDRHTATCRLAKEEGS